MRSDPAAPPAPAWRRLHDEEDGAVVLSTVVIVLFFVVLLGLVANVGLTVRQKVEAQNAADAVALSAATVRARALNALTATNHLIGELEALVVLHHAIGGDPMDGEGQADPADDLDEELEAASEVAEGAGGVPEAGDTSDTIGQPIEPTEGATLHDSFVRLKQVMLWTYETYTIGGLLQDVPPPFDVVCLPLGIATSAGAKIFETKAVIEWRILKLLAQLAQELRPLKRSIRDEVIPGLYQIQRLNRRELPGRAQATVEAVGSAHGVRAAIDPPASDLGEDAPDGSAAAFAIPVRPEPASVEPIERSQLVRAAYPWVAAWRGPIRQKMHDWLILSKATDYYLRYTNEFMPTQARRLKDEHGVHLPMLIDADPVEVAKGSEPWTFAGGSDRVDALFGVVAFARRPPPKIMVTGIYPRLNPDGVVTYAQALTYNANPQERGSTAGGLQPNVGWDTLNWERPVPECPTANDSADVPRVRLNWQAKLVPARAATLGRAASGVARREASLAPALEKSRPFLATEPFLTH